MNILSVDIETFSSVDIQKAGVYKYVQSPDFEIILFAYSWNGGPVEVVDLACSEYIPGDIRLALESPIVLKKAFNANFEITCLSKFYHINPDQWECTQVKGSLLGLPLKLDTVAKVLKLPEQKLPGKIFINYFTKPCKPTISNGGRTRNHAHHNPDKWDQFKEYNRQDVVTEMAVNKKLENFPIPESERQLWLLDQKINTRGIMVDVPFVKKAIMVGLTQTGQLSNEIIATTDIENPNSVSQLKEWIQGRTGTIIPTLNKEAVPDIIASADAQVKKVLQARQQMGKTSVSKFSAIIKTVGDNDRIRGLFQFNGAGKTGRWAGRLVQPHNLPQIFLDDGLDQAREVVKRGDLESLQLMYDNVLEVLSQLVRTAFIASPGKRLIVSDFAAIEARVLAWLAGEGWKLDVFNTHGKIYQAAGANMFKIPIEQITKGSLVYKKSKIAELALGYQGAVDAIIAMGGLKMGLTEDELPDIVALWRKANKRIVQYWYTVGEAAIKCLKDKVPMQLKHGIRMYIKQGIFFIQLPSGRKLAYLKPELRPGFYGGPAIYYQGLNQTTRQWQTMQTYGGKLVENITQATARDILAAKMIHLDKVGYDIVFHVHDEIVSEMDIPIGSAAQVTEIMSSPLAWAEGLPLGAESFETKYYNK